MPGLSPLLEQVGDFPGGSKFVADAVGIDFLELCGVLRSEYYIVWMNNLPDMLR